MQFKQLLLMCSALIVTACCFPTITEENTTTGLPSMESTVLGTKESKKPVVFIMEDKDPKSDSVVVQFVYSSNGGNSIIESKGSDKDKYTVDHPAQKEKSEVKSINETKKSEEASKINKITNDQGNASKTIATKDVQMVETSLVPEEISPLSQKWPRYLYDAFNPVQPFPELQFGKPNQINIDKVQNENADSYLPYAVKDKKEPLNVAGPQLSPLSIYDREFNVPIFD